MAAFSESVTVSVITFTRAPDINATVVGPQIKITNTGSEELTVSRDGQTTLSTLLTNEFIYFAASPGQLRLWFKVLSGNVGSCLVEEIQVAEEVVSTATETTIISPLGTNTKAESVSITYASDIGNIPVQISNLSTFGSAVPTTGMPAGFSDGTLLRLPKVFDLDSGAGSDHNIGISLRLSSSGGSVEGGTVSNPLTVNIGTVSTIATEDTLFLLNAKLPTAATLADATANPTLSSISNYSFGFNGTTWDRLRSGIIAATSTTTGILNTAPLVKYNSSAPVLTDGQICNLQGDTGANLKIVEQYSPVAEDNSNGVIAIALKPMAANTYCATLFTNFSANNSLAVKASPGNVFSFYCHNLNAAARYFLLLNKASAGANTNVPLLSFLIPAGATLIVGQEFFGQQGLAFSTGIAFAISTTETPLTLGAAGDHFTMITYK